MRLVLHFRASAPCVTSIYTLCEGDISGGDKAKKGVKRKKISEDNGETAKRRSARVRNTKCKKEEKVDFQELLMKFLPSRYSACFFRLAGPHTSSPHHRCFVFRCHPFWAPPPFSRNICASDQSTDLSHWGGV